MVEISKKQVIINKLDDMYQHVWEFEDVTKRGAFRKYLGQSVYMIQKALTFSNDKDMLSELYLEVVTLEAKFKLVLRDELDLSEFILGVNNILNKIILTEDGLFDEYWDEIPYLEELLEKI